MRRFVRRATVIVIRSAPANRSTSTSMTLTAPRPNNRLGSDATRILAPCSNFLQQEASVRGPRIARGTGATRRYATRIDPRLPQEPVCSPKGEQAEKAAHWGPTVILDKPSRHQRGSGSGQRPSGSSRAVAANARNAATSSRPSRLRIRARISRAVAWFARRLAVHRYWCFSRTRC
jgi:hypothetical protein